TEQIVTRIWTGAERMKACGSHWCWAAYQTKKDSSQTQSPTTTPANQYGKRDFCLTETMRKFDPINVRFERIEARRASRGLNRNPCLRCGLRSEACYRPRS